MKWGDLLVGMFLCSAVMLAGVGVYHAATSLTHTDKVQQRRKTALEKYKDQMEM